MVVQNDDPYLLCPRERSFSTTDLRSVYWKRKSVWHYRLSFHIVYILKLGLKWRKKKKFRHTRSWTSQTIKTIYYSTLHLWLYRIPVGKTLITNTNFDSKSRLKIPRRVFTFSLGFKSSSFKSPEFNAYYADDERQVLWVNLSLFF